MLGELAFNQIALTLTIPHLSIVAYARCCFLLPGWAGLTWLEAALSPFQDPPNISWKRKDWHVRTARTLPTNGDVGKNAQ